MTKSPTSLNPLEQESLRGDIATKLVEISKHFGPTVKLTLLARLPGNDEAVVVVTEDDLSEAARVLAIRAEAK